MRVRELLDMPDLGLRLLTDVAGMDRAIRRVYTTDLPDPSRYLTPGDLVLTGLIWCRTPGDADRFVSALARARVGRHDRGIALPEAVWQVAMPSGEIAVDRLILYRSHLGRGPAHYEPLAEARIGSLLEVAS